MPIVFRPCPTVKVLHPESGKPIVINEKDYMENPDKWELWEEEKSSSKISKAEVKVKEPEDDEPPRLKARIKKRVKPDVQTNKED